MGCGLYGMIGFAILTVFIAGLMVGRTPEFLGKKIEPGEMRWAVVLCLATPFAILVCSAIACMVPGLADQLNNGGAHGFSEVLYAFTSCGGNNGSAFAGMNCNIPWINVMLGLEMLFARFMPIIGTLTIAGSLAKKVSRRERRYPVYHQRHVRIPARVHRSADRCPELLPGPGAWPRCRVLPDDCVKEGADLWLCKKT